MNWDDCWIWTLTMWMPGGWNWLRNMRLSGAVLVLKGAPTVIGCPDGSVYVNATGNSAMATGGCGDVLTGIIAGLAAQGVSLQEAALAGVYLHGAAGDLASGGSVGLAAGELGSYLPQARKMVEQGE